MRAILAVAALALIIEPLSAQPPAPGAASDPWSVGRPAYVERCKRETIAAWPGARAQADSICASKWGEVLAARPMADAILALAPAPGAAFAPATVRAQAAKLRGYQVTANPPPQSPGVTISWFRNGEPVPFNLEDALRVHGLALGMIACSQMGAGEGTRIYRAAGAGKAPFVLTVAFRSAAVASQSSDYSATAEFTARAPTLASLRRDGNDWSPTCPQ